MLLHKPKSPQRVVLRLTQNASRQPSSKNTMQHQWKLLLPNPDGSYLGGAGSVKNISDRIKR
jgi:hypothetical protein